MTELIAILSGALAGAGAGLAILALTGSLPRRQARRRDLQLMLEQGFRRGVLAVVAGLLALIVSRWLIAAAAIGGLVLLWPALFGAAASTRRDIGRLEALATWTESLRDTIAGAVGLEQAIPASLRAAPPAIEQPLRMLVNRLRSREMLVPALVKFADEFDDPSADLIVAALVLNARLRGPGLRDVLGELAESARAEVDMRRRVEAQRRSTRRSVQIVTGVVLTVAGGLVVLNRDFLSPYDSAFGQLVLATVIGVFALGFGWLRRLARFDAPGRFLSAQVSDAAPQGVT